MINMFFLILKIYQDLINEYNNKIFQIRMQHTIHEAHKGSWSISQTKWSYKKIIIILPGPKNYLIDFLFFNAYLMIS